MKSEIKGDFDLHFCNIKVSKKVFYNVLDVFGVPLFFRGVYKDCSEISMFFHRGFLVGLKRSTVGRRTEYYI